MKPKLPLRLPLLAALALVTALCQPRADAAETLRVGKAVPEAFSFLPLDVGMAQGFFQRNGIAVQEYAFAGDAKLQQAMAAGSLDIGLGSGPAMAFIVKGAPIKAVAAMAGPPLVLILIVRPDGPRTIADLKGKRVSVSTAGSLTYWLVSELSRQQGWGPHGIAIAPMGAMAGQTAALARGDSDGMMADVSMALDLAKQGKARILARFGNIVPHFHNHIIFATNTLIADKPLAISGFLKGWFETIAFMRADKAATVATGVKVLHKDADTMSKTYDEVMPMFSADGRFDQKALQTLGRSWVDLKILPQVPDLAPLYTEAFLPSAK